MKEEKIIEIVLWVCLIFVLVYYIYEIFIWRYFNDKENSAPPIVIDKSTTKKNLEGALFTNNQNIPSIDTGYNDVSLNNPCDLDNPETLSNNTPNGRRSKKCAKGLKCVSGVVKGGNICLLENGETCLSSRSCAPPYSCINGICQEKTEIINKPCDDNSDCQVDGIYRFNHVCYKESNSVKGICKYDIYPLDSGCRNKDECRFSDSTLNEVNCITDVDLEKIEGTSVIFYSGIDGASDKRFGTFVSLNNDVDFLKNRNSSVKLEYSSGSNFNTCRVLNVKGTSVLLSCGAEILNSSKYYISDVKLKGICLVDYPLGTSPPTIPHYDEKYPCVTGASTFGGDFCVENSRGKNGVLGKNNQICQQTSIPCDKSLGLDCTFNNNVVSNISINYNTENGFINHTPVNSIGKCFHQTQRYLEPCSNNLQCIAPNICINSRCKTSEYPFKSTNLINCPNKYQLSTNGIFCLGEKDQPFLESSDCVNPSKGLSNRIVSFNNDSTNFSQLYPPISEEFSNPKILMSKTKSTNSNNPSAFGFYNLNNNGVSSRFTIGVSNYKFNINFPSSEILNKDKINLSIFEKGDGNHRLNISYIKEYETYRLRLYDLDYNNPGCSIYSTYGIYEGACVAVAIASEHNKYYFIQAPNPFTYLDAGSSSSDSTTGIVTWNYSPSGGDFFGIPDSTLTEIKNEGLTMYLATYSSKYSVVGEQGSDKFLLFNLMPPNNTDTVQENLDNPNYINLGDGLKYHKDTDDIDFLPGNHPLIDGDLFTAFIGPPSQNSIVGTSVNKLFLTQNNINAGLSIGVSESNGKFGYHFSPRPPYEIFTSFSLNPNFGVNVLMYDIDETTPVNSDINIELSEKNNLFDTGLEFNTLGTSSLQNNPIGYFSGLSTFNDINLEIDENNIFLNYNLSKEISYTLGISYGTSENIGTCESYSENRFYSFNSYSENSTPKTNVISYRVNNNFCPPKIKTSLNVEIDETIRFPNYEIDRVQNYKNISDKNKVDVLVNYKNIETTSLEFPVLIESELYKIDSKGVGEYSGLGDTFTIKNVYYSDSDGSKNINPSPTNSSDLEPTFRYSTPIRIQNFTEDSSSDNFYTPGTYQITIKEKLAIDVILKYSGSEIVIGFYSSSNIKYHWIITKVIDYTVSTSEEYLILQINVAPLESISYKDFTPYLFVNNIIPLDLIENNASDIKLTDGNCFKTSCINNKNNNTFPYRTYYDKIGYYEDTNNSPNFKNVLGGVSSSDPRSENPYFSDLEIGDTFLTLSRINNKIGTSPVAINNLFLNFIYKPIPVNFYYNNYFPDLNFNKNYIDFKEGTSIGGINLFVNTIPYYSGTSSFYPLDNSYKEQIFYSTERTENPFGDDSGKINIQKLIINNNPGNMLNEMSYYLFYSDNSKNYFTYINSNFSQNSNILNTSPVLNLQNGASSKAYQENSFMTPYDKKLYILGETCNG